jgi:hypothetical protein
VTQRNGPLSEAQGARWDKSASSSMNHSRRRDGRFYGRHAKIFGPEAPDTAILAGPSHKAANTSRASRSRRPTCRASAREGLPFEPGRAGGFVRESTEHRNNKILPPQKGCEPVGGSGPKSPIKSRIGKACWLPGPDSNQRPSGCARIKPQDDRRQDNQKGKGGRAPLPYKDGIRAEVLAFLDWEGAPERKSHLERKILDLCPDAKEVSTSTARRWAGEFLDEHRRLCEAGER